MKEIKDDINRWRYIPCSWVGRINIVKMNILSNAIHRFSAIPVKLPMAFFTELEKKKFTFHMETQKTANSQRSLEKEEWSWRNQTSWLQSVLQSYSHQNSMVLAQKQKYRPMKHDIELRDKPTHLWELIFDKPSKNIQWGKDSLFSKWCQENWRATCKKMQLEHYIMPYTKINSKWVKDLNVRPETITLRGKQAEHSME